MFCKTRPIYEHTSAHLARQLQETVGEWKLEEPDGKTPIAKTSAGETGGANLPRKTKLKFQNKVSFLNVIVVPGADTMTTVKSAF